MKTIEHFDLWVILVSGIVPRYRKEKVNFSNIEKIMSATKEPLDLQRQQIF